MPFLLLSLLLQAQTVAVQPDADTRFQDWLIRLVPIAISLYVLLSGRSREDRKAVDKALEELKLAKETQLAKNTNFQLELERMGDEMKKNYSSHELKIANLGKLSEDMIRMTVQLEHQDKRFDKMEKRFDNTDQKIDHLLEELRKRI